MAVERIENSRARAYVSHAMEVTKLDPTKVAQKAGLAPSTVTDIMREKPRTQSTRLSTIVDIYKGLNIPLTEELRVAIEGSPAPAAAAPSNHVRDVPIYALLSAPGRRYYYKNEHSFDQAPRPAGLASARRAYALRMPDDSMEGWRKRDELVFVDPTRPVGKGDHAVVAFSNTQAPDGPNLFLIRRVEREDDASVTLATWGQQPSVTPYDRSAIVDMHRVVEWPELFFG